ncbi:MAG: multiheme c-type cytochrome [bacterium]
MKKSGLLAVVGVAGLLLLPMAIGRVALGGDNTANKPMSDVPAKWKYPHNIRGGVMSKTDFQSVESCRNCHTQFYHEWNSSGHGQSWKNITFQTYYKSHLLKTGYAYDPDCLSCHAPLAVVDKQFDVKADIYKEGVTCDFCHSLVLKEGKSYENRIATENFLYLGKKRGPRWPSYEANHAMEYDDTYTQSQYCSTCHQWEAGGVTLLDEYYTWGGSPAAANEIQCQDCHMPAFKGIAALSAFPRDDVASHTFLGSDPHRSIDMGFLKDSLELKAEGTIDAENAQQVHLKVTLTNKNNAHMAPAGLSWRRLVLIVRVRDLDGNVYWEKREDIRRTLGDESGNPVVEDWYAKSVLSDTRLKPAESRVYEYPVDTSKAEEGQRLWLEAQVYFIRQPNEVYDATQRAYEKPWFVTGVPVEIQ